MRAPLRRFVALIALGTSACAAPAIVAPVAPAEIVVPSPPAPPSAEPDGPPLTREEALARAHALAEAWTAGPRYQFSKWGAFLQEQRLDEPAARRLLDAVARECLAEPDGEAIACKELRDDTKDAQKATAALVATLGELADPAARSGPSIRLLVRLDARRLWEAGHAVARVLERRLLAGGGRCEPPAPAEIEAARRSLVDLAVLAPEPKHPPGGGPAPLRARWPTPAELDDLAYLYAVVADTGPEVGKAEEDRAAKPLPEGHPDVARREGLRNEMHAALLDGDLVRHLRAAEAYLASLGYPGPLRLAEERDQRWGGAFSSYVMRDAARSAEIAGRYELAEALYRRAQPGGGMCGTSVLMRRDAQLQGVIRAAEQSRGCRAAAAERLYDVAERAGSPYGPERLARAGLDVPRLYAGALLMLDRDDAAELERALRGLPAREAEAVARLARMGPEAWASRVRALPGYADTAQGRAIPRLFELAEGGRVETRTAAITAVGDLAEDHGFDPCIPTTFGYGWGHGSGDERTVHSVMGACPTRLDAATVGAAVRRVEALAIDPEPTVRTAAAVALGRLAATRSRRVLGQLARDPFASGGQICTQPGTSTSLVCEPDRPVARAAREALEHIAKAEELRAEQRAARKK